MKKKIITIALLAILSASGVGCQKDTIEGQHPSAMANDSSRAISFSIDGIEYHTTINNNTEWQTFIDTLINLSYSGHRIIIADENASTNNPAAKETQTYTTTNKDDASKWSARKIDEGFRVSIMYDARTGEYICIATR